MFTKHEPRHGARLLDNYFCTRARTLRSVIVLALLASSCPNASQSGSFPPALFSVPLLTAMLFFLVVHVPNVSVFHHFVFLFIHDDGKCKFTIKFPSKYGVLLSLLLAVPSHSISHIKALKYLWRPI